MASNVNVRIQRSGRTTDAALRVFSPDAAPASDNVRA